MDKKKKLSFFKKYINGTKGVISLFLAILMVPFLTIAGALINAACVLGVIAAGGSEEQIAAAGRFAGALGLAFQIRDDMLDVIGNAEELGKATGVDTQKNTFVRLYGLEKCEELVRKYTRVAIDQLAAFRDVEFVAELAQSLTERKK